jgi:hypothetical protein
MHRIWRFIRLIFVRGLGWRRIAIRGSIAHAHDTCGFGVWDYGYGFFFYTGRSTILISIFLDFSVFWRLGCRSSSEYPFFCRPVS